MRNGTHSLVDTLDQKTETHLVSVSTDIGLTNKYSLAVSIPFIINRSVNRSLDDTEAKFGDLSVMLRAFYGPRVLSKPANLQFALGATAPVGQGVANIITDEQNFASGTVDPLIGAILALGIEPGWNVAAKFFSRKVLFESSDNSKTGSYYYYTLQLNYAPIAKGFSTYLGMSVIDRGQDEIEGIPFTNSGGDWIILIFGGSGQIIGEGESAVELWAELQLPVYKFVHGFQLTEKWNLRLGVGAGLSLFGHHEGEREKENLGIPIQSE